MITIENELLEIQINPKGAELSRIKGKHNGIDYLWKGDPAFWGKHSPVLFPIVGTLKNNVYSYKGTEYSLPRHGFARDKMFEVDRVSPNEVVFSLASSDETKRVYPFDFFLRLRYRLINQQLEVFYEVENPAVEELLFSIGGHPAFAIPLEQKAQYHDYFLQFDAEQEWLRWPISSEGLVESDSLQLQPFSSRLHLSHQLFTQDALVFKNLIASKVKLESSKSSHGWEFDFSNFPYLGLWAAKGADFVCIEPWCGIADSVLHHQDLESKEGIERLKPGGTWTRNWTVTFH